MNNYYLSLCRGLTGYYVLFKANDEETIRLHAKQYFGLIWCSIYTEDYYKRFIAGRYPAERIINADNPIELEDWRWE